MRPSFHPLSAICTLPGMVPACTAMFFLTVFLAPVPCGPVPARAQSAQDLVITSPAFSRQGNLPVRYTCEGDDLSPPLNWSGLPAGTKSLVLMVEDPDAPDPKAPKMVWDHWLVYNIPVSISGFEEGITRDTLPDGALTGRNSWKRTGYGGPCPPIGRHRYFHRLYALDTILPNLGQPDKQALKAAMGGHILGATELVGTYKKGAQ